MKKQDDPIAGPHHYWTHFSCGLVFGAGIGLWLGGEVFNSDWPMGATAVVMAGGTAWGCGRWGDHAWYWLLRRLSGW